MERAGMARKLKEIIAGDLHKVVLYTAPEPHDGPRARAQKSRATTEAQQLANDKTARAKLELLFYSNFTDRDLFVTLTYRDKDLPHKWKAAQECIRKFLRRLREHRKKRGQPLKYIYVTEGRHGDHRLHHHLIINATGQDMEAIRSLWAYGDIVDVELIRDRGMETLAAYMTKESMEGRPVGARMWASSKNLKKPIVKTTYVPNDMTLSPPLNCRILEGKSNQEEFGFYIYYKYLLIPPRNPEKGGPQRPHSGS